MGDIGVWKGEAQRVGYKIIVGMNLKSFVAAKPRNSEASLLQPLPRNFVAQAGWRGGWDRGAGAAPLYIFWISGERAGGISGGPSRHGRFRSLFFSPQGFSPWDPEICCRSLPLNAPASRAPFQK